MTKTFTIYRDNKLVAKASLCLEMLGIVQYQAYNLLFSVELLKIWSYRYDTLIVLGEFLYVTLY